MTKFQLKEVVLYLSDSVGVTARVTIVSETGETLIVGVDVEGKDIETAVDRLLDILPKAINQHRRIATFLPSPSLSEEEPIILSDQPTPTKVVNISETIQTVYQRYKYVPREVLDRVIGTAANEHNIPPDRLTKLTPAETETPFFSPLAK